MTYTSIEQFINKHLRFKQHWNKKTISSENAHWQFLDDDTYIDGIPYSKNSQFKVFETNNFGWIVFHHSTKTVNGDTPNKFMHKW